MTQWISVQEQLPEFEQEVLVSIEGHNPIVLIGYLDAKKVSSSGTTLVWRASDDEYEKVSNAEINWWMPLPTPATIPQK
jgi:hypothetical protein